MDKDWRIPLSINLWLKSSPLFVNPNPDEEDDLKWHCKGGLTKNI